MRCDEMVGKHCDCIMAFYWMVQDARYSNEQAIFSAPLREGEDEGCLALLQSCLTSDAVTLSLDTMYILKNQTKTYIHFHMYLLT